MSSSKQQWFIIITGVVIWIGFHLIFRRAECIHLQDGIKKTQRTKLHVSSEAQHYWGFWITQLDTHTHMQGRNPLNEWSARRRGTRLHTLSWIRTQDLSIQETANLPPRPSCLWDKQAVVQPCAAWVSLHQSTRRNISQDHNARRHGSETRTFYKIIFIYSETTSSFNSVPYLSGVILHLREANLNIVQGSLVTH
jgi:hypothetical protein